MAGSCLGRAFATAAVGLSITIPSTPSLAAQTPVWRLMSAPSCVLSRNYSDGTFLTVRRVQGATQLTVRKPGWEGRLPTGSLVSVTMHYGGGGFGHPREVTAKKLVDSRSKATLVFTLDEDDILTFKVMNGIKLIDDGGAQLTGWMSLDGSASAYTKLSRCRVRQDPFVIF